MIYNETEEYRIRFFKNIHTGEIPVEIYLNNLSKKDRAKILKYVEYLRQHQGVLDEPYSKHIRGKIRELRVDFARNHHRIFFFTFINRNIVLLHGFLKTTKKTPEAEITKAEANYFQVINNRYLYED